MHFGSAEFSRHLATSMICLALVGVSVATADPPSAADGWTVLQVKPDSTILLGNPHFDTQLPDDNKYFHYTYWDFAGAPEAYAVDTVVDHGGGTTAHSVFQANSASDDRIRLAQQAVNAPWTLPHLFAPVVALPAWDYNFRSEQHLPLSSNPPTFDHATKRVVIPEISSMNEFMVEGIASNEARSGHPLMSNTALRMQPWARNYFDVLGHENNRSFAEAEAEPDLIMSYRRALARYKPFATIVLPTPISMRTESPSQWAIAMDKYFKSSLFWGIFPSFDDKYLNPEPPWPSVGYPSDGDCHWFTKYVPLIQDLNMRGWEPITGVRATVSTPSDQPATDVYLERYGGNGAFRLTVHNTGSSTRNVTFHVESTATGVASVGAAFVVEMLANALVPVVLGGEPTDAFTFGPVPIEAGGYALFDVLACPIGVDKQAYYRDGDGDGYGDAANSVQACAQPGGFVPSSKDCNDSDPSIYPFALEICNGVDDDCDESIDEDPAYLSCPICQVGTASGHYECFPSGSCSVMNCRTEP